MSQGWENYEPAPLEFFHGRLMDAFHEWRIAKFNKDELSPKISGNDLNNLIAKAKTDTYKKYPKHITQKAILKSEM